MHVIDSLAVGGAERMLVDLVNTIDSEKYSVSVCITRSEIALLPEIRKDIPVSVLNRKNRWDLSGFKKLRKFSREQEVDLFHAHGRSTLSFLLAAQNFGYINAPVLLHDHFGNIEIDQSIPTWFKFVGSHQLDYYVGVSSKLVDWAERAGVRKEKAAVVNNALDLQRYQKQQQLDLHEKLSIPPEKKIGIMVGNLRPAKGLDLLIEACENCSKESLPVFIIVGESVDQEYVRNCKLKLEETGLSKNFYFVGKQSNSIFWIKGADFAVMSSRSESGPLVLIEYMTCGKPFIAFNVGEISNIVKQYFPGNFAQAENTEQFSKILQMLLNSKNSVLQDQGKECKKVADALFDIQQKLPAWYEIYANILEKNN